MILDDDSWLLQSSRWRANGGNCTRSGLGILDDDRGLLCKLWGCSGGTGGRNRLQVRRQRGRRRCRRQDAITCNRRRCRLFTAKRHSAAITIANVRGSRSVARALKTSRRARRNWRFERSAGAAMRRRDIKTYRCFAASSRCNLTLWTGQVLDDVGCGVQKRRWRSSL